MPATEGNAATWTSARASFSIFTISVGVSLFAAAYEKVLNPLFGGMATAKYMGYVVNGSTALALILPKVPRSLLLPTLGTLVLVAPHTSYWISVFAARNGDPALGALVAHATVLVPVIYLAVSLAASIDTMLATVAFAANALQLRPLILLVARYLHFDTHKDVVFFVLGSLTLFVHTLENVGTFRLSRKATVSSAIRIAKKLWIMSLPIAFLLFPALRSPTLSSFDVFPYQSKGYHLRILNSTDSVTGVVVVGELLPLQPEEASPKLLFTPIVSMNGASPRRDQAGTLLGDSIYGAFVLQEAARLASTNLQGDVDKQENALIIGLGTGISADAFMRHGISTTIVEIDPAVYDAARKHFGLQYPGDGHVFLEDARHWVYKKRAAMQSDNGQTFLGYDIVVHDCFSGGGVPQHLFSVEFWNDLKSIIKPDGVVAVNLAGGLGSHSTRAVFTTLQHVFGQCRIFHDLPGPIPEDQPYDDFLNMVFFCSPTSRSLTFRPARDADYLHSHLRRNLLSSLDRREVSISQLQGGRLWSKETEDEFVLTDMNNTLNTWQSEEAVMHWKIMRKIFPDIFWETY
ncbi:S-adenosyl-L-methionine-dependent methyltransferase [Chiua virens]|nr:S-adenosyl-L-methionine-dependent methyltransferase [Chiua virens]